MTSSVTIEAAGENGLALEKLAELIGQRERYLKGETTQNAVTATAINVVTSVRGRTKSAPLKASPSMYTIERVGSAEIRGRPRIHRAVIDGHWARGIFPVNLMYRLAGRGDCYKITLANPNIRPGKKSKNPPCYYVLAPTRQIADNYAKTRVTRVLKKEAGMAKYALGVAQAKVSDRPMNAQGPTGSNAMRTAFNAAQITKVGGDGTFSIGVNNTLRYSLLALRGGAGDLNLALQKAANRTAAIINKLAGYKLDEPIPTPFPEITASAKK